MFVCDTITSSSSGAIFRFRFQILHDVEVLQTQSVQTQTHPPPELQLHQFSAASRSNLRESLAIDYVRIVRAPEVRVCRRRRRGALCVTVYLYVTVTGNACVCPLGVACEGLSYEVLRQPLPELPCLQRHERGGPHQRNSAHPILRPRRHPVTAVSVVSYAVITVVYVLSMFICLFTLARPFTYRHRATEDTRRLTTVRGAEVCK